MLLDIEILKLGVEVIGTAFLAGMFAGLVFTSLGKGEKMY